MATDIKKPRGKPFQKGESGNPSGRPKTPKYVKEEIEELLPMAIKAIRAILDGTDDTARASDKIRAADIVFDRNLGKPTQSMELTGEDGGPILIGREFDNL